MEAIKNTTVFKYKDMYLTYVDAGKGLWQSTMNPEEGHLDKIAAVPFLNFQIGVAGRPYGFNSGLTQGYSAISTEMLMEKLESTEERIVLIYRHDRTGLI